MAAILFPDFAHRFNPNTTTDSICRKCFLTVASSPWEADLEPSERNHVCDPVRVEDLRRSVEKLKVASHSFDRMKPALAS
jgi:hypothetical protein